MRRAIAHSLGVLALMVMPVVVAGEDAAVATGGEATPEQLQRAQAFLQSAEARQRAGAYKACRARGEGFKDTYFGLLERASKHHGSELAKAIRISTGPGTAQAEAIEHWETWESLAPPAREFVLTDHGKDKAKHLRMDKMFNEANLAWNRVMESHKRAEKTGVEASRRVESAMAAMREIHKEMAWCRPDEFDADDELDMADLEKDLPLGIGKDMVMKLAALSSLRAAVKRLADAHAFNDGLKWAGPTHKEFARILNNRRAALGLKPFRLEEKLSDACAAHSKEMAAMGYFAHESPVEENKTFVMRAEKAGFTGTPIGECIFSGNADPVVAESAWWYSDGHRLNNYRDDAEILGLGPVGITWTLNTGNLPE